MNYNATAPVFNNWSIGELEAEMMECYHAILSIPKCVPYAQKGEVTATANAAMSVLNFMSISQVVPSSFKQTLEPIYVEAQVRLNTILLDYTPPIVKRTIETHFGTAQNAYSASKKLDGNACPECASVDSIEPLYSGECHCIECDFVYYP